MCPTDSSRPNLPDRVIRVTKAGKQRPIRLQMLDLQQPLVAEVVVIRIKISLAVGISIQCRASRGPGVTVLKCAQNIRHQVGTAKRVKGGGCRHAVDGASGRAPQRIVLIRHKAIWQRAIDAGKFARAQDRNCGYRIVSVSGGADAVLHGQDAVVIRIVSIRDGRRGNRGVRIADTF